MPDKVTTNEIPNPNSEGSYGHEWVKMRGLQRVQNNYHVRGVGLLLLAG